MVSFPCLAFFLHWLPGELPDGTLRNPVYAIKRDCFYLIAADYLADGDFAHAQRLSDFRNGQVRFIRIAYSLRSPLSSIDRYD
jgi:hypothetical protein